MVWEILVAAIVVVSLPLSGALSVGTESQTVDGQEHIPVLFEAPPKPISAFDDLVASREESAPALPHVTSLAAAGGPSLRIGADVPGPALRAPLEDWRTAGVLEDKRGSSGIHAVPMRSAAPPRAASHLEGKIDAGGPYGGPGTFEGDTVAFTVTVSDASIIFFRWDFNNDSVFDFPDQTGGGDTGRWTTSKTVTWRFLDDAFGDIVVEGWDGTSQRIAIRFGDNLAETPTPRFLLGYGTYTFAWEFTAKDDMYVVRLGRYDDVYPLFDMALWTTTGTKIASCTPRHVPSRWNWCNLSSYLRLTMGSEYRISIRTQSYTSAITTPPPTEHVEFGGTYYCFDPSVLCFPGTFYSDQFIPMIDFGWRQVRIFPDAARDTAPLQVNNVAPTVSGITSDPSPSREGSSANLTANFDDPGLGDTWEFRWSFADGTNSGWRPVSKIVGGARVLILHSWTGDIVSIKPRIVEACGAFCISVDDVDFGRLGQNRVPTLDELTPYDVILVGTNLPIPNSTAVGDRLAEFMDAASSTGGGVVMMAFGPYDNDLWGIGGRWKTEKSPLPRAGAKYVQGDLGRVYVPDHQILEGVATVTASYRQPIFSVNPGATRIADWTDGTVFAATKEDVGGRLACGLNYFPGLSISGDYARAIANAIRDCSRRPDPVSKEMAFDLDPLAHALRDDKPMTATHQDAVPVRVEVRDDDGGLGHADDTLQVENVDATIVGGFDSAERDQDGNVTFRGFRISDPALWQPTEWFARAWDFGDGTPVQWVYQGTMTPPKFDVLLLHTLCLNGN